MREYALTAAKTKGAVMKAEQERLPRFAVLIDADNTSPQIVGGLFEEVAKFGEASVRRIYGDFSGPQLRSWFDILQKHAIDPYQQFAYTKGKNASDIALVIDAMDLLHSGRFDGFCLVSMCFQLLPGRHCCWMRNKFMSEKPHIAAL